MNLSKGTRLGPYEIVGPAGSGGMGEVYRARDTRLDRTVAMGRREPLECAAVTPASSTSRRIEYDRGGSAAKACAAMIAVSTKERRRIAAEGAPPGD
ncbi:MAG TPA: hypothetical protein VNA04_16395 [Thermoanaerobaculia bacterium]|nr:hypothetical protein [Thermoanaerobaculia bacterium]